MTALAAIYLTERIEEAERDLALLEETYADLRDGTLHWSQWNEELTCVARQDAAIDECGMAMDSARRDLEALRAQANGGTGE
jgi:hypothetical protein